jgi:NitT/TauT family transport system substrate-binding protein
MKMNWLALISDRHSHPTERYLHKWREAPSLLSPATGEMQEGDLSAVFIWLRLLAAVIFLTSFTLATIAESRVINVAVSARSLAQVAHYVADQKGYYRDEGLEVRLILMNTPVAAQAVIAGNVEFTGVSGGVLPAAVGGAPLRFVFSAFYRPMFWLYARPEIGTLAALKGKKVAVSGLGSGPATLLLEHLKKHGLDGGRDLTILSLGLTPTRFAALSNGSVDAAILIPPFTFAAAEGGFRELVSFIKEDFVELQGSLILREELLKSEPLLVEKFVRGTLKGLRFARENRAATIPILARNVRTSEDFAAKDYDGGRSAMTADGIVDEKMQRAYLDLGIRRLGVKDSPAPEKIFDFSLTKKILSELDSKRWKPVP